MLLFFVYIIDLKEYSFHFYGANGALGNTLNEKSHVMRNYFLMNILSR